jgi:DNA-binding phage protein
MVNSEDTQQAQDQPSLSRAILSVMRIRNMTATRVAGRMQSGRNRATLYRILSGSTQDPKVSTFVDICRALDVSPIEVLQLAGLSPHTPRESDLLDIRLRQIFRHIQALPESAKRLAVAQVGVLTETLAEHAADAEGEVVSDGAAPQEQPGPVQAASST